MQIDPTKLNPVTPAAAGQAQPVNMDGASAAPVQEAGQAAPAEKLALSSKAAQVQAAHEALAAAAEVRQEMVEKLKSDVAAGTYRVDAEKVAEKLLPD